MEVMGYDTEITNSIDFTERQKEKIKNEKEESDESSDSMNQKKVKISHKELRLAKIEELNEEFKNFFLENNYESALTIMKKLIFFEPNSKRIFLKF